MENKSLSWSEVCSAHMTAADKRNAQSVGVWTIAFAGAFVTATFALVKAADSLGVFGWLIAIVPPVIGIGLMVSYSRFLMHADELLRKIHLEALALGFGSGIVVMSGYRLLERMGAPALDINDPIIVMVVVWAFAQWNGIRRYA